VGRFISEDPIRFEGGINFYAYVANNPINWIDSFGKETDCPPHSKCLINTANNLIKCIGGTPSKLGTACVVGCLTKCHFYGCNPVFLQACMEGCGLVFTGASVYCVVISLYDGLKCLTEKISF
jgi:hypothetical protein